MAGDVLDTILADMAEPPRTKARHHKVSRIIEVWKGQWGWSEVDVARALMHILPGAKAPPARQPPPESDGRQFVWNDLPSIAAALQAHALGAAASSPQPPASLPADSAILAALNQIEVAREQRTQTRAEDKKRASAHSSFEQSTPPPRRNNIFQIRAWPLPRTSKPPKKPPTISRIRFEFASLLMNSCFLFVVSGLMYLFFPLCS